MHKNSFAVTRDALLESYDNSATTSLQARLSSLLFSTKFFHKEMRKVFTVYTAMLELLAVLSGVFAMSTLVYIQLKN